MASGSVLPAVIFLSVILIWMAVLAAHELFGAKLGERFAAVVQDYL